MFNLTQETTHSITRPHLYDHFFVWEFQNVYFCHSEEWPWPMLFINVFNKFFRLDYVFLLHSHYRPRSPSVRDCNNHMTLGHFIIAMVINNRWISVIFSQIEVRYFYFSNVLFFLLYLFYFICNKRSNIK